MQNTLAREHMSTQGTLLVSTILACKARKLADSPKQGKSISWENAGKRNW